MRYFRQLRWTPNFRRMASRVTGASALALGAPDPEREVVSHPTGWVARAVFAPQVWLISVGLTALLTGPALGQGAIDTVISSRLDSALASLVEENGLVGLQVAIGIDGTLSWTGAYGMADLEHNSPVTDQTLFRMASITKWMTATAAMRLVELGQLDLDAAVQEYCPEYPEKQWTLTARHLLEHRGGVRQYWGFNDEPRDTPEEQRMLDLRSDEERRWMSVRYTDVVGPLNRFKDDPLLFEPGTDRRYTSLGYRLLGCVLRGAADTSYAAVLQEHIFDPAEMSSTRNDDAYAIIPGRARGYTSTPEGELRRSRFRDVSENLAAGGHLSTASDLIRFALAWRAGQLVSEASMEAMTVPPAGTAASERYPGLGFFVQPLPGGGRVYMVGRQDGTRTFLVMNLETGRAFAWMTNYERVPSNFNLLMVRAIAGQLAQ